MLAGYIHTNNDNTFIEEYFMVQVLPQQTQHNCLHVTTDSIPVSSITKIKKLNKTRQVSVIKCVHITLVVEGEQ